MSTWMKALPLAFAVFPIGALTATGCSESHANDDAAITFDAVITPDSALPGSAIGDACRGDMDCDDGTCVTDLPGGYCSSVCSADPDCPDGSACIRVDRSTSLCLDSCDVGAADQCRPGYGCSSSGFVCLPGCEDDTDCDMGLTCEPSGGFGGAGGCFDADGILGGACTNSDDCTGDASCFSEMMSGFPGGACVIFGCDSVTNTGCVDDAQCLELRFGDVCFDGCSIDSDCRSGYECVDSETFPGRMTCQPAFDPGTLGQICSAGRGPCTAGFCLSESETGWPDSYCVSVDCDPLASDPGCPGDGVCLAVESGAVCLDGCVTSADCRAGYDCKLSDPEDATSGLACRPGCDDSTVCGNDEFECNLGTGLCTEPFVGANLGEPCADRDDCVGGRCLTETDEGWPAGTCTYPGCRLTGTGPSAPCPAASECVDDGTGDPELGVCVDACTVGASGVCRPGYACIELTTGAPEGACRPMCTAPDCGGGTTCNVTRGLCE